MYRKGGFERSALFSVFIVAAFFLVFVGGGVAYLFYAQKEILEKKRLELTGLGKLKVEQIRDWRRERFSDARFVLNSVQIAQQVQQLVSRASSGRTSPPPMDWMQSMFSNARYSAINMLAINGKRLASIPSTSISIYAQAALLEEAVRSRSIVTDDVIDIPQDQVRMHVCVPVFDPLRRSASRPIAVTLFEIDPTRDLYELTNSWPVPSSSAEVILFRLMKDSVVYLNETRHHVIDPVHFRMPISDPDLPAAWGARGNQGLFEGKDYREVEVIAYVAPVPESPWFVVAKIDRSEALEEIVEHELLVGIIVLFGTLLSAASFSVLRRESARKSAVERLEAERKLVAVRQHHADIMKHANDIIILSDSRDRILEANQMACDVYGYQLEELIGQDVMSLRAESERSSTESLIAVLRARGMERFETQHVSKGGRVIPVEVSLRMFTISGVSYIQRIIRDVTERKAFEREILRLNRMYHVLSDVNQLIVRERDERRIFEGVCRVATELGGFLLAWIGRATSGSAGLEPVASDGPATRYLAELRKLAGGDLTSWGIASQAVRDGKRVIVEDLERDTPHPLRTAAARREGIRSGASFPLTVAGKVWGAVTFYSADSDSFTEDEVRLLDELASDLSYALTSIDTERQRALIEQKSQRQRELLDEMGRMAEIGGWEFDTESLNVVWTDELVKIYDMEPGATIDVKSGLSYYSGKSRGIIENAVTEAIHHGTPWDLELEFISAKKVRKWVRVIGHPVHEQGKVARVRGTVQDITKRREHELEILRLNRTYKVLSNINQLLVRETDERVLLEQACRIAVADGGFALVWAGRIDPVTGKIGTVVGQEGVTAFLREVDIGPDNPGPPGFSLRSLPQEGQPIVCNDIAKDDRLFPWREAAGRHGLRSSAAFPLLIDGTLWGGLHFYSSEGWYFNDEEIRLLDELASDLSFALNTIDRQKKLRETEVQMAEREEQYRALFDSSPDALFLLNPHGHVCDMNQVAVERYHYTREEFLGMHVRDLAAPSLRAVVNERVQNALEGESQFEWRHVRKDGTELPVEIHSKRVTLRGEPYLLSSVRDITDRKRSEELMRYQELLLKEMGRIAKVGAWEFDVVTQEGTWTEEVARIYDLDPGDPTNVAKGLSVYKDESRTQIERAIGQAIAHGTPYDLELEMVTSKGAHKWVRTIGMAIQEGGRTVRVRGSFQDITERKVYEEKLRHSEERFRSMVEQAGAGYFFIDLEGRYRHVNAAWLAMYKFVSPEEVLGRHFEEMQEDANRERAHEIIRGIFRHDPDAMTAEFSRKCKDGSIGYHTYSSRMVSVDGQPVGIEGFLIDTTERRKVEAQLEEQLNELRRWHTVSLDREERVQTLKREVNSLLMQAGLPSRYAEPEPPRAG